MPSVRIRGRAYSELEAAFPKEIQGRLHANDPEDDQAEPLSDALVNGKDLELSSSRFVTPQRPQTLLRSSTISSRIHAHCTLRDPRFFDPIVPDGGQPSPPPRDPLDCPTAPSSNPVQNGGETGTGYLHPGLIDSSINLSLSNNGEDNNIEHHHDVVVEHLDVIDSEIGAISNLANAANSIVIPPSSWYSRKPIVVLPSTPRRSELGDKLEEYEDSLDRHVDDVLRRPSKFRRTLRGVWSFLKTPMGIVTGIYGFLVVFWGAAIVVFLAGIINLHNQNTQRFWIEVSSQVETGLFTLTSIGLIPSRVLDTYRIWKIWRYKQKTKILRKEAGLPQLFDSDDLPDPFYDPNYVHVLAESEQNDLHRQQRKFQYSQTWYRAHGTETHRAFSINLALLICFLNDGNSIFQVFLCGTMWGLNRFERPPWTTGVLIPGSFLCGIGAAIVIWRGGENTKRVEEVRNKLRAALSGESSTKTSP